MACSPAGFSIDMKPKDYEWGSTPFAISHFLWKPWKKKVSANPAKMVIPVIFFLAQNHQEKENLLKIKCKDGLQQRWWLSPPLAADWLIDAHCVAPSLSTNQQWGTGPPRPLSQSVGMGWRGRSSTKRPWKLCYEWPMVFFFPLASAGWSRSLIMYNQSVGKTTMVFLGFFPLFLT